MPSNYSMKYCVDITMVIDATGSMRPLLDTVKNNALNFYGDLMRTMNEKGKKVHEVRVRVIAFRDYLADGKDAMLVSEFYTLPDEAAAFEELVRSITPFGGGDDPEDGLEALAYAIKSKWTKEGYKRRHIIIVWTDEGTHALGFGRYPENGRDLIKMCGISWEQIQQNAKCYPARMAHDFDELTDWWGDESMPGLMDNDAKRLLLYAPDSNYWSTISKNWNNVIHHQAKAGKGLEELEYQEILDAIVGSV